MPAKYNIISTLAINLLWIYYSVCHFTTCFCDYIHTYIDANHLKREKKEKEKKKRRRRRRKKEKEKEREKEKKGKKKRKKKAKKKN